jgi:hypothetical protein
MGSKRAKGRRRERRLSKKESQPSRLRVPAGVIAGRFQDAPIVEAPGRFTESPGDRAVLEDEWRRRSEEGDDLDSGGTGVREPRRPPNAPIAGAVALALPE